MHILAFITAIILLPLSVATLATSAMVADWNGGQGRPSGGAVALAGAFGTLALLGFWYAFAA